LFNVELRIPKSKIQNRQRRQFRTQNSKLKTEQFKIGFADNSKLKIQKYGNKNHASGTAGRGFRCTESEDREWPDYEVQHHTSGAWRQVREPVCGSYARQYGSMPVQSGRPCGCDDEILDKGV
jgi:hypothetical protein